MTWGQPIYLILLLIVAAWLLLRWWLDGREKRVVASTIVWKLLLREPIGKAVSKRRIPLSVLMEGLLLLFVVVALADPAVDGAPDDYETIVLVDRGQAMASPNRRRTVDELLKKWPGASIVAVGEASVVDWHSEIARYATAKLQVVVIGDRFESVPTGVEVHVVDDPINNRGITAVGLNEQMLLIGVAASMDVHEREVTLAVECNGGMVRRTVVLSPGEQVDVLIPRDEVVTDGADVLQISLVGTDDIEQDNAVSLPVKQAAHVVGVEPRLDAVAAALLSSGFEVLRVGANHDGEGLSFVAGLSGRKTRSNRMAFAADGAPVPSGKWSATGHLDNLPLTSNESTPAFGVEGEIVLLSRGGVPVIAGDPVKRRAVLGVDPNNPVWQRSELFCLAIHRVATWLTEVSGVAMEPVRLLPIEEVRGDATPSSAQESDSDARASSRTPLYPWFLMAALALFVYLSVQGLRSLGGSNNSGNQHGAQSV